MLEQIATIRKAIALLAETDLEEANQAASGMNDIVNKLNDHKKVFEQIADSSYVVNYGPEQTVKIYREWAQRTLDKMT